MSESEQLIIKAKRFLNTAQLALESGGYDSSVSRSYYGMFFMAEAALLSKGVTASSHKGVISLFGEYFIKPRILRDDLGRALRRAFDLRQKGDYSFESPVSESDAETCLQKAKAFVSAIETFLSRK